MIIVLYGVETYCINNRVHQLIQEIDDMNVSRYQGLSREAVAATSRYPIMADKQAVIVETEKLTGDDTKMLESLDIPETTIFIVVVSGSVKMKLSSKRKVQDSWRINQIQPHTVPFGNMAWILQKMAKHFILIRRW